MKILKDLKRNFNKCIAILLCFTLIFSNSLVTLADTNFDESNTETSESIVEDIEEENLDNENFNEANGEVEEEIDEPENDEEFNNSLVFEEEPEEDIDDIGEEVENESEENIDEENAGENEENDNEQFGEETGELNDEIEESTNEDISEENGEEELEELEDLNPALFGAPIFQAPSMLGEIEDGCYLVSAPTKTTYAPGETIDFSGLTVKEVSGGVEEIYTYPDDEAYFDFRDSEAPTEDGTYTISFRFITGGQYDLAFNITVTSKTVTHIDVDEPPTKTTYNVGEAFDPAGLTISLEYTDGSFETVPYSSSVFSYSPTTAFTTTGTQIITITHIASDFRCSQFITVIDPSQPLFTVNGTPNVSWTDLVTNYAPNGCTATCTKGGEISGTSGFSTGTIVIDFANKPISFSNAGTIFEVDGDELNVTIKNLTNTTFNARVDVMFLFYGGKLTIDKVTAISGNKSVDRFIRCDSAENSQINLSNLNLDIKKPMFRVTDSSNIQVKFNSVNLKMDSPEQSLIEILSSTNVTADFESITALDVVAMGFLQISNTTSLTINLKNNNIGGYVYIPIYIADNSTGTINVTNGTYDSIYGTITTFCPTIPAININSGNFKYGDQSILDEGMDSTFVLALASPLADPTVVKIKGGKFKNKPVGKTDAAKADLETYAGAGKVKEITGDYDYQVGSTPTPPTPTPSPSHSGGSSGGGGGGGTPIYSNEGQILRPGATLVFNQENIKVVTGNRQNISIMSNSFVDWNRNSKSAEVKPIIYDSEKHKFVNSETKHIITSDWVGVVAENGNINWYYTNNDGSLIQSQLLEIGDKYYCFGDDGIMLKGTVSIGGTTYYFSETKGVDEGVYQYKL